MKKLKIICVLLVLSFQSVFSQVNSKSSFMGSSLIHMPSTEDVGKDNLDFRFNHRFGNAKSTSDEFLGLDAGANTQLSLDYGITDNWSLGIARTSAYKTYEARTKYKILSQDNSMPITLSFFGVFGQETSKQTIQYDNYINPPSIGSYTPLPASAASVIDSRISQELNSYTLTQEDKRSYLASFLISRRFTERISMQISPMYVHRNFVKNQLGNDRAGIDIGGRIKLTKRIDFTFEAIFTSKRDYKGERYSAEDRKTEYTGMNTLTGDEINQLLRSSPQNIGYAAVQNIILDKPVDYYYVPFSFGLDIETGGHIFQLFITNNRTIAHTQLLRGADFDYAKRDWAVGFNIHRYFSFAKEVE